MYTPPTGSRFPEIAAAPTAAAPTLAHRTPRVTAPVLPTADAAREAQNQGSTELPLYGVLRSWHLLKNTQDTADVDRRGLAGVARTQGKGTNPYGATYDASPLQAHARPARSPA